MGFSWLPLDSWRAIIFALLGGYIARAPAKPFAVRCAVCESVFSWSWVLVLAFVFGVLL